MYEITISKWGNSLGFRIPSNIVKSLELKDGDKLTIKEEDYSFNVTKTNNCVKDVLCNFYHKDIDEILSMNIKENDSELSWGEDVGDEIIK